MKSADTTFLIDLANGVPQAVNIARFEDTILTTQINIFEFIRGFFYRGVSEKKYGLILEMFENMRVLQLDDKGTIKSAEISAQMLKIGTPIDDADCLIAGIMLANGVKHILTRNALHFEKIKGLKIVSY